MILSGGRSGDEGFISNFLMISKRCTRGGLALEPLPHGRVRGPGRSVCQAIFSRTRCEFDRQRVRIGCRAAL